MSLHTLIVGASAAGYAAAHTLQRISSHRITLIDSAPHEPINVCRLAGYIAGRITQSQLAIAPGMFSGKTGTRLVGIDPDNQHAYVEENARESTIAYDQILIATGTVPNIPILTRTPNAPPCVPFHTLENAELIKKYAHSRSRVAILGAGINGIELAVALRTHGVKVTLIERSSQILPFLPPEATQIIYEQLISQEITLQLNKTIHEIAEIESDLVVTATGVRATPGILKLPGMQTSTGELIVTPDGRTSIPHMFAAGDCAAITYGEYSAGPTYRWTNALKHGIAVAQNMNGDSLSYIAQSHWSTSTVGSLSIMWNGAYTIHDTLEKIQLDESLRWNWYTSATQLRGFVQIGMLSKRMGAL